MAHTAAVHSQRRRHSAQCSAKSFSIQSSGPCFHKRARGVSNTTLNPLINYKSLSNFTSCSMLSVRWECFILCTFHIYIKTTAQTSADDMMACSAGNSIGNCGVLNQESSENIYFLNNVLELFIVWRRCWNISGPDICSGTFSEHFLESLYS